MKEMAFIRVEKELLRMKTVRSNILVDEHGVLVELELSPALKFVYKHMQNQYLFFSKQNKAYFENQDTIADQVGLSERSVNTYIKQLVKVGLIEKKAKRIKGAMHSNSYIVHDIFDKTRFRFDSVGTEVLTTTPTSQFGGLEWIDEDAYLLAVQRQDNLDGYAAMQFQCEEE